MVAQNEQKLSINKLSEFFFQTQSDNKFLNKSVLAYGEKPIISKSLSQNNKSLRSTSKYIQSK